MWPKTAYDRTKVSEGIQDSRSNSRHCLDTVEEVSRCIVHWHRVGVVYSSVLKDAEITLFDTTYTNCRRKRKSSRLPG